MSASEGTVLLERRGVVAYVTVDRPRARNAMTMEMYARLHEHIRDVAGDEDLRVVVLRGAGGSFVAGTDIAYFEGLSSAEDGIAYERAMEDVIQTLESLPVPTVALVEGAAVGGGLILAVACDLRVCTPDARFGMPIARTVGHTLSVANHARLSAHLGPGRTKAMLMLGEFLDAGEAHAAGFIHQVLDPEEVDEGLGRLCRRLASHAPLTLRATKQAVRRVLEATRPEEDDDLLRSVYGSRDFRRGVRGFLDKKPPRWEGS